MEQNSDCLTRTVRSILRGRGCTKQQVVQRNYRKLPDTQSLNGCALLVAGLQAVDESSEALEPAHLEMSGPDGRWS
jgi:hypothetical protein